MIDQRTSGGQWVNLGSFFFNAGTAGGAVALSNLSFPLGQKVIADAVRFVGQGTSYP